MHWLPTLHEYADDAVPVSRRNGEPGVVDLVPRRIPGKRVTGLQESCHHHRTGDLNISSDPWINRSTALVLNSIVDIATQGSREEDHGDGPISFDLQHEREVH